MGATLSKADFFAASSAATRAEVPKDVISDCAWMRAQLLEIVAMRAATLEPDRGLAFDNEWRSFVSGVMHHVYAALKMEPLLGDRPVIQVKETK